MKHWVLEALLAARAARASVAVLTRLADGTQSLLFAAGGAQGDLELTESDLAGTAQAIDEDRSTILDSAGGELFVHVFNPPPRLIVVGAVHIAEPLVRIAALAGYDITVIDPRRAFAERDPFEGVAMRTDWPDGALTELAPDRRTAIVTLTHDPKLDDPALATALATPAFYVGALGSRKTQAERLERLRQLGVTDEALARVRGPVGLPIGARTPAEIAVSIMAEVTQARRSAS
jgi:xanthine dehydrogenase accessory factor